MTETPTDSSAPATPASPSQGPAFPAGDGTGWPALTGTQARLIVVRHGQTAHNAGRRLQGHTDIPLNDEGAGQARRLGAHLAEMGVRDPSIHSSDLRRAAQTAEAIRDAVGGTLTLAPDLREIHMGDWEGEHLDDVAARDPERNARFWAGDPACGAPNGETPAQVTERVAGHVLANLPTPGGTLIVVSHGIAITGLLCRLMGLEYARTFQERTTHHANTAFSVLTLEGERVVAQHLARLDHLNVGTGG